MLPEAFFRDDDQRRLNWVRDAIGKGARVEVANGLFRPSRDQFWRVLDALVDTFTEAVVSVDRSPGRRLPRSLGTVGWEILSDVPHESGMVRRTWRVTRETIRRTPSRSDFLWRHSA